MNEFKTVVENIEAKLQIVAEGVQHLSGKMDTEFRSMKEQIALLHDGQTELRAGQRRLETGLVDVKTDLAEIKAKGAGDSIRN